MRAAELIGCHVYDADGQELGIVHDLHFRLRTQPDGSQTCELDVLECGGIGLAEPAGRILELPDESCSGDAVGVEELSRR